MLVHKPGGIISRILLHGPPYVGEAPVRCALWAGALAYRRQQTPRAANRHSITSVTSLAWLLAPAANKHIYGDVTCFVCLRSAFCQPIEVGSISQETRRYLEGLNRQYI